MNTDAVILVHVELYAHKNNVPLVNTINDIVSLACTRSFCCFSVNFKGSISTVETKDFLVCVPMGNVE